MLGQLEYLLSKLQEAEDMRSGLTPMQMRIRQADPVFSLPRGQGTVPFRDPMQGGPAPRTDRESEAVLFYPGRNVIEEPPPRGAPRGQLSMMLRKGQ